MSKPIFKLDLQDLRRRVVIEYEQLRQEHPRGLVSHSRQIEALMTVLVEEINKRIDQANDH